MYIYGYVNVLYVVTYISMSILRLALFWLTQGSRSNVTSPSGFIFRYSTSCKSQNSYKRLAMSNCSIIFNIILDDQNSH